MDGLILCRGRIAENPFFADDTPLYSIEELCYYIYENIYIVSEDFFSEKLAVFLEEELGETQIAQALRVLMKNELRTKDAVLTVLMNVDYYPKERISAVREILEELDSLKPYERIKACGDTKLKGGRYGAALENYARALEMAQKEGAGSDVAAGLHHNRGVAYGRMLFYRNAAECFEKAYRISGNPESRKQWLLALQLGGLPAKEELLEEEQFEITNALESAMDHASLSKQCQKVQNILEKRKNGVYAAYCDECSELIEEYKKNCLNSMA